MKKTVYLLVINLLLVGSIGFTQKKSKNAPPPPPPPPPVLDVSNSDDVNKMERKIASSLKDGEDCVYWWEGHVYTRIPGEKDRLLFNYYGMNVRSSKGFQDPEKGYGWKHVSRELLFYLDPKTNEILRTWKNPFTNEEVEVFHVANDPVNGRGISWAKDPLKGPAKFRYSEKEGYYFSTSEAPLFYTNPLAGEWQDYVGGTYHATEVFNFIVKKDDLLDATKDKAEDIFIAWSRFSKFLPWMKMGDRFGYMIFTGTGKKLKSGIEGLPEPMKEEMRKNYPEYFKAPPLDDTRPNETSWTYFLKKMNEKKKAK